MKIPENFNGFKIAVIADLHNHRFGNNQERLIKQLLEQNPDIVVLAGDVIDKRDKDLTNVKIFLAGISGLFPIYSIPGNHDYMHPVIFDKLFDLYQKYGVTFMDGNTELIERGNQSIAISSAELKHPEPGDLYSIDKSPTPVYKDKFNILLHHFGNEFDIISDEYDLILSGHVHGGVVRIFNTAVFSGIKRRPFFPKYSKGVYRKESGSVMVLSAGLGNTLIPRFNNPREIVIVTLKTRE